MLFKRVKPLEVLLAESGQDTPTEEALKNPHTLKRSLGPVSLTAMGIGAIIGTGIFVLTGVAAAKFAGPSLTVSFVIAGIVSALAALCYSEVASRVPISGSAYTFAYASMGELIAWIIGWDLVLEYALGAATVSIGWSGYFSTVMKNIGLVIPQEFLHNAFDTGPSGEPLHGIMNLPAFCIIILVGFLLYRGTRESAVVNNAIVAIKVCIVLFFIVIGIGHVDQSNWTPYFPFGWGGTLFGAFFIFFAYIGFDAVSTAAEETKNPKRDLPVGIIGSLAICTVLYIIVAAILTGMVSYTKLNVPQPVAYAIEQVGLGSWASMIVSIGAIAGLTTVLLVMMFGQTRVFFAMSRDGLLPSVFSKLHPTFQTPGVSTIVFTLFIACVAAFTPISVVGSLTNMGTLAAFVLVSIALPILRKRYPTTSGFTVPFGPYVIPTLSAVCAFALLLAPFADQGVGHILGIPLPWFGFIVWLLIGLIVYFAYSRSHSKVGRDEARALLTPASEP
jgi:APA family basic amino acid/polyamine antiporter